MKRPLLAFLAAFVFLSASLGVARGYVVIHPLDESHLGDTSYWPQGLKQLAERYKCIAGQEIIAPSWGRGTISAQLCFAGNRSAFNGFLKEYAKVKHQRLVLTLHPGKGAFRGAGQNDDKAVPFDWQLSVAVNGLFKTSEKPAEISLGVAYYVGDAENLSALDIPPGIEIKAGYDDEYRQAHQDDDVKAIDALLPKPKP